MSQTPNIEALNGLDSSALESLVLSSAQTATMSPQEIQSFLENGGAAAIIVVGGQTFIITADPDNPGQFFIADARFPEIKSSAVFTENGISIIPQSNFEFVGTGISTSPVVRQSIDTPTTHLESSFGEGSRTLGGREVVGIGLPTTPSFLSFDPEQGWSKTTQASGPPPTEMLSILNLNNPVTFRDEIGNVYEIRSTMDNEGNPIYTYEITSGPHRGERGTVTIDPTENTITFQVTHESPSSKNLPADARRTAATPDGDPGTSITYSHRGEQGYVNQNPNRIYVVIRPDPGIIGAPDEESLTSQF